MLTLTIANALLRTVKALCKPVSKPISVREHLERCGYYWIPFPDMVYLDSDGWPITSEQMREALKTFK